jgi:hypothetical protein
MWKIEGEEFWYATLGADKSCKDAVAGEPRHLIDPLRLHDCDE